MEEYIYEFEFKNDIKHGLAVIYTYNNADSTQFGLFLNDKREGIWA